jgi:folate-dependent phosphoribosylglycinamide formyltransferase PurN
MSLAAGLVRVDGHEQRGDLVPALLSESAEQNLLHELRLVRAARCFVVKEDSSQVLLEAQVAELNAVLFGLHQEPSAEQEVLEQLRRVLELDARRVPAVVALLVLAGFDDARIAAVVPAQVPALLAFAGYLEATGSDALAAATWRRVLDIDPANAEAARGLRQAAH